MQVLGAHNVLNALAAVSAAWVLGVPGDSASKGLATFTGADRRLQFKGEYNGAKVYDDYAHHPGELAATLKAVRSMGNDRVVIAFQPHTYTRTKALFEDFVRELQNADVVILSEIYAARERNTVGISSRDLCAQIPGSIYCETLPDVTEYLRSIAQPGDLILTVGAGDIYRAGEALVDGTK
jgi:UDP-N-acetylmuramate--alanine ligase